MENAEIKDQVCEKGKGAYEDAVAWGKNYGWSKTYMRQFFKGLTSKKK